MCQLYDQHTTCQRYSTIAERGVSTSSFYECMEGKFNNYTYCSYVRIRFRANNPGTWLFHCHTESHLDRGMALMVHVSHVLFLE